MELILLSYFAKATKGNPLKIRINGSKNSIERLNVQHIMGHCIVQGLFFIFIARFFVFAFAVFGKRASISTSSIKKLVRRVFSSKVNTVTLLVRRNRAI